jgi:hypothetical protein
MYAALFIVAQLVTTPAPRQTVLDGCNTMSAIRAAEIRLMAPEHPRTKVLLDEILREPDGAVCLLESDVLVDLHRVRAHGDLVARALADGLSPARPHVAWRAHEVIGRIGRVDPGGFAELVRRIDVLRGKRGWVAASERDLPE